ncbi:type 1 fimbrial protein [Burkholderia sp. Bp9002]|nr:type 1 fimbrial protein [Burkholderia sp. Bp9002]
MRLLLLAFFILAGMSTSARAFCTSDTNDGLNYYRAQLSAITPPEFDPSSIPIGGVIHSQTVILQRWLNSRNDPFYFCNASEVLYKTSSGMPTSNVYPTSMPNIGLRIAVVGAGTPFPIKDSSVLGFGTWQMSSMFYNIQLIKTGEITAGGTLDGSIVQYRANDANGQLLIDMRFASPVVIRPSVPTCKVATSGVTVQMDKVATSQFKGVGTSTYPRAFGISLACSGGAAGTSTNAHVTLTDATVSSNTSNTLSLTKESTATGVGIQILQNDKLLGFGPDSGAAGNINQWHAGTIKQGEAAVTIPLRARYVQTGAKVLPGSANARVTFTMSYQ